MRAQMQFDNVSEQSILSAVPQKCYVRFQIAMIVNALKKKKILTDMNSGSSRDWLKGVHNLNISYTIEMRDTGKFKNYWSGIWTILKFRSLLGSYGFVLPPEQILPNALEMFDGIKAIVDECRTLNYL